jgi:hypothetical protein
LLRSVGSLDLSQQVIPTFPMTYRQISKQSTFKYNTKKHYWYLNGYLYFPNVVWDAIKIEGVFEEDISKFNCDAEDVCISIQDQKINIPEFLFSEIEQLVIRDLGIMINIPADPGQNATSVTS